jgi:hypothetical protein
MLSNGGTNIGLLLLPKHCLRAFCGCMNDLTQDAGTNAGTNCENFPTWRKNCRSVAGAPAVASWDRAEFRAGNGAFQGTAVAN